LRISNRYGLLGVGLFALSLLVFGISSPSFDFLNSYISELGAKGTKNAIAFNLLAFIIPGLLLALFGWSYGQEIKDKLTGSLLGFFGIAFGFTAIPIDSLNQDTPYSKAHVVAICLALAAWLFGLARISGNPKTALVNKKIANTTATLLTASMILGGTELIAMPITHRLVFTIVFGWTLLSSLTLKDVSVK